MCIFGFAFCKSGTTFHSFRRVRVCVCLVGFASLQSPWAHTLKASLPLYERSVGFASLQSLWAFISGILALLAPPVAPNLFIPAIIAKGQQPLAPHHHTRLITVFPLQKQLHPFSRLFNRSNFFCTFLTSPSTRAILLLALAKTN